MGTRAIIHVDMDAFYASVEQRDDPTLRGKPVIVGGHARRGVVLAASYEVRPFGVRSAMPMAQAVRLAPKAIVVSPRFEAYAEASERVFAIFESMTPLVEPLSLDEAFLDVTASVALFGAPAVIASTIRRRIADELSLPASAGIAAVKMVAKIASDLAKPNGQIEVPAVETQTFLAKLPIGRLWGVGPRTEETLRQMGLTTIGSIAACDLARLEARLGESGRHLWMLSRGEDDRDVISDRAAKSIGSEDTFAEDLSGVEALSPHVHSQALRVARRMRKSGLRAAVVVLKLKSSDFKLSTRRVTLAEPTDDGGVVYRAAIELLERAAPLKPIRLTGVSVQALSGGGEQLSLLGDRSKAQRLNRTLDAIADRFGREAVRPADLLGDEPHEGLEEVRRRAGASRLDVAPKPQSPKRGG